MKKTATLFALSLLLASSSAFADLTGYWTGQGTLTDPHANLIACKEISYKIRQSRRTIALKFGYVACGNHEYNYRPVIFRIHGNHMVANGKAVGTFENGEVHLDYIAQNGMRIVVESRNTGDVVTYREAWFDYYGKQTWLLEGTLARQPK
jgi:hypothetical protein